MQFMLLVLVECVYKTYHQWLKYPAPIAIDSIKLEIVFYSYNYNIFFSLKTSENERTAAIYNHGINVIMPLK